MFARAGHLVRRIDLSAVGIRRMLDAAAAEAMDGKGQVAEGGVLLVAEGPTSMGSVRASFAEGAWEAVLQTPNRMIMRGVSSG
jgi:hypothetical protein